MKTELTDKIIGYHYTNSKAYDSMKTKGIDGYSDFGYEDFAGIIPQKRFIRLGNYDLPIEAHNEVIEGLLEPEPKSWTDNPEFPGLWSYLMHDVCRNKEIMLLSFELHPEDKAYVVERAHIERELYREAKGLGNSTPETLTEAYKKYWESKVPVFDYMKQETSNKYSTPQLAIWSGIDFDRLKIEWIKPRRSATKSER